MAEFKSWLQRGDDTLVVRPGVGQAIKSIGYALDGSTGNNAIFRLVTGELTGITVGAGGSDYTAAGTRAYAEGDGKRVQLGAVTVAGGAVTAIAIPDDDRKYGFATAPTIVIDGDGDGNAAATSTVTRRVQTLQSTTGQVRNGYQVMITRDVWAELEASDNDDWAHTSGYVLP